jgi:glycosyltransferase involved in cell wall biosynthesis
MPPHVLFVSKPVVAPFNDGSKCLVRDIASGLNSYVPRVMVTRDTDTWSPNVLAAKVYAGKGSYRPALVDNARVFLWLLARSQESIWHFLFAPNRRTSQMGKLLRQIRGIPTVQTVASPPRSFHEPQRLLFGDIVVAQSQWTRNEFLRAFVDAGVREPPPIEVIPPAVPDLEQPSAERQKAASALLDIPENASLLLYPGDLEVSHGAQTVAKMVEPLLRAAPDAVIVFAYREKTPQAAECARALRAQLAHKSVRFISEVPDMHALLAISRALLFPVDDLYGKVDLPIVILEAMHLGVPVVTFDRGPLADLKGVLCAPPGELDALVQAALRAIGDNPIRENCILAQRETINSRHKPLQVARLYEAIYDELLGKPRR